MARNPYQMDPFLAQGLSNLTKALIGDAETDYQTARTNRLNQLLPLEKQQIEAQIATSNARQTLINAQTLTENQLRDPRVQTELARAKEILAAAGRNDAQAGLYNAQTQTENELRTPRVNSENANTANINASAQSRLADAMLTGAKTDTENALRVPRVNTENAQTAAAQAQAAERNASANQTNALTQPKIDKIDAETNAAEASANERNTSAELNRAKIATENRVVLNKGQTIVTTNENGERETYTAPETVTITLDPGEEGTVIMPDGSQKTIKGPPVAKTNKPGDGTARLKNVDDQINIFFDAEAGSFPNVNNAVLRRIRSNITSSVKGKAPEEAAAMVQDLLSQTYDGKTEYTVSGGWFDGPAFSVPAFVVNQILGAQRKPTEQELAKYYGLSKDQATALLQSLVTQ